MFAPLHFKSHYSLGYGTAAVSEIVARAARFGLPALALTDLENLYGQVELHHACRAAGVRPITGVELRPGFDGRRSFGRKRGRVVLLGADDEGYARICRIVTRRRTGHGATGDPVDDLLAATGGLEGLFVLSDDAAAIERLAIADGVDRARLRLLLVRPGAEGEREILEASDRLDVPVAADPDPVFLDPGDHALHALQVAIRRRTTVAGARRSGLPEEAGRALPDPDRLRELYRDRPEAIAETLRVARACRLDLTGRPPVLPALGGRDGEGGGDPPAARLERQVRRAFLAGRSEGRWRSAAHERRLDTEIDVIGRLGLADYFLAIAEIAAGARARGIEIAGRGSAAASLIAHVLGLTPVDPVAHGLLLERFLHDRKRELPDFDLDVASDRRDELVAWAARRFGERAAVVSSLQRFRLRSAVREGLKALGLSPSRLERVVAALPPEDLATGAELPSEALERPGFALLSPELRAALPLLDRLIGTPQHLSAHPGGLALADRRIDEIAPLERAPKGLAVTQYDAQSIGRLGLVKIDLLGNHLLTEIQTTIRLLADEPGAEARALRERGPSAIPDDDPATLTTIDRAETVGCFQLESPAIRSVLKRLPVRDLEDVVAALALVRPGAAAGAAKERFLRRARGEAERRQASPEDEERPRLLSDLLADTRGVLLYEEDLMRVLAAACGIGLGRADELRQAIGSGDPEELSRVEGLFLDLAGRNGIPPGEARAIWAELERLAAYTFARAHAASYAVLGYRAAYMKTRFPLPFGCALLEHHGGMYPPRTIAAEVRRWGVPLLPPSVQRSSAGCTVEGRAGRDAGGSIRIGLGKVKRLSRRALGDLLESRTAGGPFRDAADLLRRVRLSRREVEALVLSGACDGLAPLAPSRYPFVHERFLEGLAEGRPPERAAELAPGYAPPPRAARVEEYRALVRVRNELQYLDMHVSDHPMRILRPEAERHGCVPSTEIADHVGREVRFAGIVAASHRVPGRGGRVLQFVTFEDERGLVEAVLDPDAYRRLGDRITTPGPFLAIGVPRDGEGDIHLVLSDLVPFHQRERPYGRRRTAASPAPGRGFD